MRIPWILFWLYSSPSPISSHIYPHSIPIKLYVLLYTSSLSNPINDVYMLLCMWLSNGASQNNQKYELDVLGLVGAICKWLAYVQTGENSGMHGEGRRAPRPIPSGWIIISEKLSVESVLCKNLSNTQRQVLYVSSYMWDSDFNFYKPWAWIWLFYETWKDITIRGIENLIETNGMKRKSGNDLTWKLKQGNWEEKRHQDKSQGNSWRSREKYNQKVCL